MSACYLGNAAWVRAFAMSDKDEMLNSREVAHILVLSPDTVNEFAGRSVLPAI